ncbi:MAG: DUF481 domain-containing protein [Sulfurimonas sp.]|uniref:DUF481 domain-containing protein n=1 Tax=Sulfurimonas sp. TaxID=2022749 RepID=UPI0028CFB9DA|nr:DUF481 domain-containing protein [Sulfurimonas sp.]MDT8338406.1 DUF481 domain-containing protein [Sulfurimonas sp.]
MKFLLLVTLIITQHLFALVSITPVEIGDKPGFSSTIEAALETKRGNTDTDSYKASARTTYDSNESYVAWAEISGAYGKANGEENTNKLFSHARYIHAITKERVRGEGFLQLENDEFKHINSRALAGLGARFKLHDMLQNSRGYLGIGAFYEDIVYNNPLINPSEENIRANAYFAYSINFNANSSVAYTLYYQPKVNDFSDNVQSHEVELKLDIYKNLLLKFSLSYNTDSKPPIGVERYDFTQNTSFIFNF